MGAKSAVKPVEPRVLRARGYVRVSTEEQTRNHSLDHQQRAVEEYSRAGGLWLQQVYPRQAGAPGAGVWSRASDRCGERCSRMRGRGGSTCSS